MYLDSNIPSEPIMEKNDVRGRKPSNTIAIILTK